MFTFKFEPTSSVNFSERKFLCIVVKALSNNLSIKGLRLERSYTHYSHEAHNLPVLQNRKKKCNVILK